MAALFAACVNDDFETISKQQNAASDGRPTVSDVKLEFAQAEDPATRVIFDGKYHWQSNDTIGALLMDNVITLDENSSWLEKYGLVGYIHTSYPFTYNSTEDTWGCNTKMLEGNYFFAYPWESYDGQRQVTHSLLNQSQEGIGANVVAESYAKNQFFIGYSRIMAGAEAKDVLNTVEMVSTLGAIQLRITNTGTQTYHINKVVLSGHDDVASVLTFDPTDRNDGKNTLNMPATTELPLVVDDQGAAMPNTFFTDVVIGGFDRRLAEQKALNEAFGEVMEFVKANVEAVTDAETANEVSAKLQGLNHVGNSRIYASRMLDNRCKAIGLKLNKEKRYEAA